MTPILFLAFGMFVMGFEDYLFSGLLPEISQTLQSSVVSVAQGCTSFGIAYTLSVPLCAFLLSKKSLREVLIIALLLFFLGNILTLFSYDLLTYILSRFISGLAGGLFLPVAVAAGSQLVSDRFRGRALSMMWSFNSAGAVIGVPLGLWIANMFGWRVTIVLILILAMFAFVGILLRKQDFKKETSPPSLSDQLSLLLNPKVLMIIGVTFLTATGCLGLYSYISQVLLGTNNSSDFAFSLWSIGGLIGSSSVGALIDRKGDSRIIMLIILIILFLSILSIPFLRETAILGLIPFLIWGAMGWSSVMPQQYSLIKIKPENEAILVALNSTTVSIGSSVGTAIAGLALNFGLKADKLPFLTVLFVFCAIVLQLIIITRHD